MFFYKIPYYLYQVLLPFYLYLYLYYLIPFIIFISLFPKPLGIGQSTFLEFFVASCYSGVAVLHDFTQQSLNSGFVLVQILLPRFTIMKISDNLPNWKSGLTSSLVSHSTKTIHHLHLHHRLRNLFIKFRSDSVSMIKISFRGFWNWIFICHYVGMF